MKELKMFEKAPPPAGSMFDVAVGPHYRLGAGLARIYQRWVLALIPAAAASWYYFGFASMRVFGLCVVFSVLLDLAAEKLAPSRDLTSNWSSISLAFLLACMLPLDAPWWLILVGCMVMIFLGKKVFGGVGAYPVQPAVLAVAVLQLSWPYRMDYTKALKDLDWQVTMVEPLRMVKSMGADAAGLYSWNDLLFGSQVAGTASGMVLFLMLGGALLLLLREVQWQAPAGFVTGLLATAGVMHLVSPAVFAPPLFYLLSGGTVFMAFFLITDHTTTPVNKVPLFLYGVLAGVLLIFIRGFSKHADGVAYAVLLVNLCAPLLDMIKPRVKGGENV